MMTDSKPVKNGEDKNKIHEPLSSYYPPPIKVSEPTIQNTETRYKPHTAVIYVKKGEDEQQKTDT
ncbi:MAG: hypothetical protein RQM92_16165 [Candidatus Syntrophopropionicum ammoniitolerans]